MADDPTSVGDRLNLSLRTPDVLRQAITELQEQLRQDRSNWAPLLEALRRFAATTRVFVEATEMLAEEIEARLPAR